MLDENKGRTVAQKESNGPRRDRSAHEATRSSDEKRGRTAAQGEVNRLQGNYSEAIACFTEALSEPKVTEKRKIWLLAHRGAAYGAMFAIEEAERDLTPAIKARPYPWALGQLAEAHRLYVLTYMAKLDRQELWHHLSVAYRYFNEAITQKPADPWLLAHRGAMYSNAYWAARRLPSLEKQVAPDQGEEPIEAIAELDPDELARRAEADFQSAIALSPGYAWAYGFYAYMCVLRDDFDQAEKQLGKGQAYDVNQRMSVKMLCNLAKLYSYQKDYATSVNAGWLALQKNPSDLVAAYFVAVGLQMQGCSTAPLAIRHARHLLDTVQVGVDYMRESLKRLESGEPPTLDIERVLKDGDLEVRSIFFHDPTWREYEGREALWRKIFPNTPKG